MRSFSLFEFPLPLAGGGEGEGRDRRVYRGPPPTPSRKREGANPRYVALLLALGVMLPSAAVAQTSLESQPRAVQARRQDRSERIGGAIGTSYLGLLGGA